VFERYTKEARGVVVTSQEQARALRHNYIGTEHLLLALLRLPQDSGVGRVLTGLGLSFDSAAARLRDLVPEGEVATTGQLPFTPRVKQVLELALRDALGRGDPEIGPEHILIGITRGDEDTVAMRLLRDDGVTAEQVRDALLGSLPPPGPASLSRSLLRGPRRSTVHQRPIEIDLSEEGRRLLMSAGARALDDGRTLIEIADIEEALRRRGDAEDPPDAAAG
jgi:ATP-dependent Clp protease ATP-binding subunit ClpC